MSNVNAVSRLGDANKSGANQTALFLEVFSGEVLNAFNMATVTMSRHKVRSIPEGKSATFPATGTTTAAYHTPGNELAFNTIEHDQRIITINSLLISPVFIDVLDEAMNHYDVRSEYAKQIGQALAEKLDKDVLRNMVLGARSSSTLTADLASNRGTILTGNAANEIVGGPDYTKFITGMYYAAQTLDEKNIPDQGRQAFIAPLTWYSLFRTTGTSSIQDMINRDLGGAGSLSNVQMPKIAGIEIVKTNNLPNTNEASGTNHDADLDQDYSDTVAVVNTPDSVGTVKLIDLKMESEYDLRRQGHIILGKIACGHGVLRPECAVEINDAGSTAIGTNTTFHEDNTASVEPGVVEAF
jgi:hypothetical protein